MHLQRCHSWQPERLSAKSTQLKPPPILPPESPCMQHVSTEPMNRRNGMRVQVESLTFLISAEARTDFTLLILVYRSNPEANRLDYVRWYASRILHQVYESFVFGKMKLTVSCQTTAWEQYHEGKEIGVYLHVTSRTNIKNIAKKQICPSNQIRKQHD